jgi:dUTP pyrophosphatase
MIDVKIYQSEETRDLPMPRYMSDGSSGLDLCAAVNGTVTVPGGGFMLVPTGIHLQIPQGFEGQVRPRSGLAAKHGVTVLNTPGTIDSDYRGEIRVILINLGDSPFEIKRGDRIAQLVICRYERVNLVKTDVLDESKRGRGGFGHTGI